MNTKRKRLNAKVLRDAASIKLQRNVTVMEAAKTVRIGRRNWQRFEYDDEHPEAKRIPDSVIKMFCDEYQLDFKEFDPTEQEE